MFNPKAIYFENNIKEYQLGRELLEKYKDVEIIMRDGGQPLHDFILVLE